MAFDLRAGAPALATVDLILVERHDGGGRYDRTMIARPDCCAGVLRESVTEELDTPSAGRAEYGCRPQPPSMTRSRRMAWSHERSGGLGSSAPRSRGGVGDIRTYFPTSVVQVMQRDAIERLHLTSMLLEPELLDPSSQTFSVSLW